MRIRRTPFLSGSNWRQHSTISVTAAAISKLAEYVLDVHQHHQDVEALRLHLNDADGETIFAGDNAAGTRGTFTGDLANLVSTDLCEHDRDDVEIQQKGDGVVATVGGVGAAAASEAQKTLLGLLASLFDARLHGSELAALIYDESEFDAPTADMIWQLCAAHIALGPATSFPSGISDVLRLRDTSSMAARSMFGEVLRPTARI